MWLRLPEHDLAAVLAEVARHPGDAAARLIGLAATGALDPDRAGALALEEIARSSLPWYVAARIAMALDPRLARDGYAAFAGDPRAARARTAIELARLDALALDGEWDLAWAHWKEVGAHLLREAKEGALSRYRTVALVQAWRRPAEEVRAERSWILDTQHPIDVDAAAAVAEQLRAAADVRAACEEPGAPAAVAEAARALTGADGPVDAPGVVLALWTLRERTPSLRADLDATARSFPALLGAVCGPLGRVSGRWAYVADLGAKLSLGDRAEVFAALAEADRELDRRVGARSAEIRAATRMPTADYVTYVVAALVCVAFGLVTNGYGALGVFAVVIHFWVVDERRRRRAPKGGLDHEDERWADALCADLLRAHGLYAHELAAMSVRAAHLGPAIDRMMADPWADLAALGPTHLRRAQFEDGETSEP